MVGGLWFILQIATGNYSVIEDFIVYQIRLFQTKDAGHGGFLLYHFAMIAIGVFPAVWLALPVFKPSIYRSERDPRSAHLLRWMMILFWVVLILFTIVRTKIVHYSSLTYFPLTFMAAWYTEGVLTNKLRWFKWQKVVILVMAVIYAIAVIGITFFDSFKDVLLPHVDEFTAGMLQAEATWSGFEMLIGILFLICAVLFVVWSKHFPERAIFTLLLGSLFFVSTTMYFVVPEVEKYSQASLIEFMKSKQGEDCYIYPIHKSYSQYFYSERTPENNNQDKLWLMSGEIDRTAYFVLRDTNKEISWFESEVPDAKWLYSKNGFSFYIREPNIPTGEEIEITDNN